MELGNLEVDESILNSFDTENLEIETIMFQAGYLTIKKVEEILNEKTFILGFLNLEVKKSFNDYLLDYLINNFSLKQKIKINLLKILMKAEIEKLKEVLTSLYASVPYTIAKCMGMRAIMR